MVNAIDSNTVNKTQYGTDTNPGQPDVFHIIPDTTFGITNYYIGSPSLAGYSLGAYLTASFHIGLDLNYLLDLGYIGTKAHVTSALTDLVDNDPTGYAADSDPDLYTDYILDTARAGIEILLTGTGGMNNSYANLTLFGGAHFAVKGAGLYDDNDPVATTDIFDKEFPFEKVQELFSINHPAVDFDFDFLRGHAEIPRLPTFTVDSGVLTSNDVFRTTSGSADGPVFASLTFDPVPFIPILGEINDGSYTFIESPLIDAGVEWRLLTAELQLGALLTQSLKADHKAGRRRCPCRRKRRGRPVSRIRRAPDRGLWRQARP